MWLATHMFVSAILDAYTAQLLASVFEVKQVSQVKTLALRVLDLCLCFPSSLPLWSFLGVCSQTLTSPVFATKHALLCQQTAHSFWLN